MESRKTFHILLGGQVASWLGSGMAGFATGVWIFQQTGSATQFALMTFFGSLPALLVSPLAGVFVDRWDRRWVMILGDTVAALTSVVLLFLLWPENRLAVWHLYVVTAINASFSALQQPAFQASIPLLVRKEQLGKAAGLVQMGTAAPQMLAPLLAGGLFVHLGLAGVLVVDLVTAGLAISTLLFLRIPRPPGQPSIGKGLAQSLWGEALEGWRFLRDRRGLLALLALFATVNLANGMVQVLLPPMILSVSGPAVLGGVLVCVSGAFLVGGAVMAATGGPKRRVPAILTIVSLQGLCLALAGMSPSTLLVAVALAVFMLMMPLALGSSQVIWQRKVPPQLMGRVFATRRLLAMSTLPAAYLAAGPLADGFFEPAMAPGGWLVPFAGRLLGVGPGRGIALLFVVLGAAVFCFARIAAKSRRLMALEEELEDQLDPALVSQEGVPPVNPPPRSA